MLTYATAQNNTLSGGPFGTNVYALKQFHWCAPSLHWPAIADHDHDDDDDDGRQLMHDIWLIGTHHQSIHLMVYSQY